MQTESKNARGSTHTKSNIFYRCVQAALAGVLACSVIYVVPAFAKKVPPPHKPPVIHPTPKPTTKPRPTAKPTIKPNPTTKPKPTPPPRPTVKPKPTTKPPTPRPTVKPNPTATPIPIPVSHIAPGCDYENTVTKPANSGNIFMYTGMYWNTSGPDLDSTQRLVTQPRPAGQHVLVLGNSAKTNARTAVIEAWRNNYGLIACNIGGKQGDADSPRNNLFKLGYGDVKKSVAEILKHNDFVVIDELDAMFYNAKDAHAVTRRVKLHNLLKDFPGRIVLSMGTGGSGSPNRSKRLHDYLTARRETILLCADKCRAFAVQTYNTNPDNGGPFDASQLATTVRNAYKTNPNDANQLLKKTVLVADVRLKNSETIDASSCTAIKPNITNLKKANKPPLPGAAFYRLPPPAVDKNPNDGIDTYGVPENLIAAHSTCLAKLRNATFGTSALAANAVQSPNTIASDTAPTDGAIDQPGNSYDYEFDGSAGQVIRIDQIKIDNGFDGLLRIYDPEGNLLATDDDSGGDHNARIQLTLPVSGTYRISAKGYGDSTGAFDTQITTLAAQPDAAVCGTDCDGDHRWIQFDQTLNGAFSLNNDRDTFYIALTQGRTVSLHLNRQGAPVLDGYLELYSPNGVRVATNDDGGGTGNAWVVYQAAQSGVYRVVARSYNTASSGTYQLVASAINGDNFAQGQPAAASNSAYLNLEPWQANDGNANTGWTASREQAQWWQVDLGENRTFDQITLQWDEDFPSAYGVYVLADGACATCWQQVLWTSTSKGGQNTLTIASTNARYVQVAIPAGDSAASVTLIEAGVNNLGGVYLPTVPTDDAEKTPDSQPVLVPLAPADEGKTLELSEEQEYAPLASEADPDVIPTDVVDMDQPMVFINTPEEDWDAAGNDVITLTGEASANGKPIVAYEWRMEDDTLLSTEITATVALAQVAAGEHTFRFSAQDSDGVWSDFQSVTLTLEDASRTLQNTVYLPVVVR